VNSIRRFFLHFNNIDFSNKLTNLTKLEQLETDDGSVKFDLSKVLMIPRKVYDTNSSSELLIELYTYEANLTTDYGTKRLSVPYSISWNSEYSYETSTDGVYQLRMIDFNVWSLTTIYQTGDIVAAPLGDALYVSKVDANIGHVPSDNPELWGTPTDEEIIDYSNGAETPPAAAISANGIISRYAKYNYIAPAFKRTTYKEYDDDRASICVVTLQMLREKALFYLMRNQPISAAYMLHLLKLRNNEFVTNTKVHTSNIKYSI